jgi:hypothetical protein
VAEKPLSSESVQPLWLSSSCLCVSVWLAASRGRPWRRAARWLTLLTPFWPIVSRHRLPPTTGGFMLIAGPDFSAEKHRCTGQKVLKCHCKTLFPRSNVIFSVFKPGKSAIYYSAEAALPFKFLGGLDGLGDLGGLRQVCAEENHLSLHAARIQP